MQTHKDENGDGSMHPVFISYRRVDDRPPPDDPKAKGFVRNFWTELDYELTQLGLPEGVLWLDRNRIEGGDDFTSVISDELARSNIFVAILSRNYIQGGWCQAELEAFATRFEHTDAPDQKRRIFRVDKQSVPDNMIPPALQRLHAVQFFERDAESGGDVEFYYRGRVQRKKPYRAAIRDLADLIFRRLNELGFAHVQTKEEAKPLLIKSNGRAVYVARPGADLREPYDTLVQELQGRGYRVVPDPKSELPNDGAAALETVRKALADAELSIHLVGERRGFCPDGLSDGVVPMQLAEAGRTAAERKGFGRLIWAPKVLPGAEEQAEARDPLDVLERFDTPLDNDQIDGDTPARFNEFVLQHLSARSAAPAARTGKRLVYVGSLPVDQKGGMEMARQVKQLGASPILAPVAQAEHAFFCWGEADEAGLLDALYAPAMEKWRAARPGAHLVLVVRGPASPAKEAACELGEFGPADVVLSADAEDFPVRLAALLNSPT